MQIQQTPHDIPATVHRLSTTGCFMCPRKKLLKDLQDQVTQWQSDGDSVIIMADMNEDIQEDPVLSVTNMGVTDAVTTQHGNQSLNTHNHGSAPINGIFLQANLMLTIQLGYLAFGKGIPSNHWVIWVDIPVAALGWLSPPDMVPLKAWWLECEDPWIVACYNQELEKALCSSNLPDRLHDLENTIARNRLTCAQQWQLEAINEETTKAKLTAGSLCRKLMVGKVPWCPQLTHAIAQILHAKKNLRRSYQHKISGQSSEERRHESHINKFCPLGRPSLSTHPHGI